MNKKIKAIQDILWMARRYADMRQTYAVDMFNDSYDILRDEFGEKIDLKDKDVTVKNFPYATDGGGKMFNRNLKNRKYFKKNEVE